MTIFSGSESGLKIISNNFTLSDEQREQLTNLSLDGRNCLFNFWTTPYPEGLHCNATWDTFFCWPTTPASHRVERSCAEAIGHSAPGAEIAKAFRVCNSTGGWLWDKTNFSECIQFLNPDEQAHHEADTIAYVMFVGSVLSFLALGLTFFIFSYFKSLHCDRTSVHKHLVFALLVRVLLNVIMVEPIVSVRSTGSYTSVDWLCKAILIMKMYSTLAGVFWMFIEGLYLHGRVTTSVFSTKSPFRMYYVLGWGFPLIIVTSWAVMMAHSHQKKCWQHYTDSRHIWILYVPICAALAMNLLFLINIIRILVTKLRASVAIETTQARKAIKATAVLFPLLGLPNLLVCVNPGDNGNFEGLYLYASVVLESSQGIFVAILYCFTNSEVIEVIKKKFTQMSWRMQPTCNNNRRKSSRSVSFFENGTCHKSPLREVKKTFWVRWASKYQKATTEVISDENTIQRNGSLASIKNPDSLV